MKNVRVIFCDRNNTLWGVPYTMRPGQSPRDLLGVVTTADQLAGETRYQKREPSELGWVYLGSWVDRPALRLSWWGSHDTAELERVRAWLEIVHKFYGPGFLPGGFPEWVTLD